MARRMSSAWNEIMDILYPDAPTPRPGTATVDAAARVTALAASDTVRGQWTYTISPPSDSGIKP